MPDTVQKHPAIILTVALCLGMMLFGGCDNRVSWLDRKEEAGPVMQRAALRANEGDIDSAIRLYKKVLETDSTIGRAHLDIALLFHDAKKDYVSAIYHYKRYLELRPTTEKKPMITGRMRLAEQLFAAAILVPGKQYDKISELQAENAKLRAEIERLGRSPGKKSAPVTVAKSKGHKKRPPPAKPARVSTYRVKRGDTLTSIATSVYGDSLRWKEIQVANGDILGESEIVKVGQLLVIP